MLEHYGPQLYTLAINVLRLSIWLAILVVIFVPLEYLFAAHPKKIFRKNALTDLGYYFMSSLIPAALLSVPISFVALAVHRYMPAGFLATMETLPLWARIVLGLLANDIGYYWGHRLSHEIPFLWRFHSIHHSAEEIDFLVNTRAHPLDMVFGRFCALVPLYVLGLGGPVDARGTLVPVIVTLIGTFWGFFIHANLKWRLGWFEWIISTPAFHHWHHTKSGPINHNYSSTLPWIDRLFGTHHLPNSLPTDYGIKAKVPDSLIDQMIYPIFPEPAVPAPKADPSPDLPPPLS